jgi:adenylosuccinate lyase
MNKQYIHPSSSPDSLIGLRFYQQQDIQAEEQRATRKGTSRMPHNKNNEQSTTNKTNSFLPHSF